MGDFAIGKTLIQFLEMKLFAPVMEWQIDEPANKLNGEKVEIFCKDTIILGFKLNVVKLLCSRSDCVSAE